MRNFLSDESRWSLSEAEVSAGFVTQKIPHSKNPELCTGIFYWA